jgi:hypothetical protein
MPRKAQEGHLEEGKTTRPIKYMKSGKPAKEQRKTQTRKEAQNKKLHMNQTPPNTLNANSPP